MALKDRARKKQKANKKNSLGRKQTLNILPIDPRNGKVPLHI
jgi:hypothetical protein